MNFRSAGQFCTATDCGSRNPIRAAIKMIENAERPLIADWCGR